METEKQLPLEDTRTQLAEILATVEDGIAGIEKSIQVAQKFFDTQK